MSQKTETDLGINSWLEDELYQEYLHNRGAVDESWKELFEGDGAGSPVAAASGPAVVSPVLSEHPPKPAVSAPPAARQPSAPSVNGAEMTPLRGAAARIAENMTASLAIPVATSQRTIPVKVVDENRLIINQHLGVLGRDKISYTHLIGWAIIQAVKSFPNLNSAFIQKNGELFRLNRSEINFGLAVDVAGKDGARSLLVPNIRGAGEMNFQQFISAFDDLVNRARAGKLNPEDFQGTTISLTNPGTVGTVGSIPRLMPGQGAIIATGAIGYPPEYHGTTPEVRAMLGIGKVMTITCTYDHRIIQGAESGLFLAKVQALLQGEENFYEAIFADLRMPHQPVRWEPDRKTLLPGGGVHTSETAKEAAVLQLINAYRVRGHLIADLDPLGAEPSYHPELDPATYGLTIWDLDREFLTGNLELGEGEPQPVATLREILETVRKTYCGKIGSEYMNIQIPEQKRWLQDYMEPKANSWPLDRETKIRTLQRLIEAEGFEHFLHARYVGHKRFSLEGSESAIAILDRLLFRAALHDVHEIVIGMAHRGRLNVLANVVEKPLTQILSEFEGEDPSDFQGSGDVKYHLGATGVRSFGNGRDLVVSVSPNPSHLEAVDPIVEGIVRPKQDRLGDEKRERVIPLLIHGDAAFAGQGVVAETLNLSQLSGYRTGGTVHLVINNQIGFTTSPEEARSTPYSTDVARMVQAPIFHVNGDDPEAAIRVAEMAFDFRQKFKKDVVIDMLCYRRHGHNEGDDPSYTQPILYQKIKNHPSVATIYSERLIRDGVLSRAEVDQTRARVAAKLAEAFDSAQKRTERFELQELSAVTETEMGSDRPKTAVEHPELEKVVQGMTTFPADFHVHPKLKNLVERRREAFRNNGPLDWAYAEALAFGTLASEGTPVRLSGEDSSRGTFSQRHLKFFDYEDGHEYCPLQHISPEQARFDVVDSSLSEYAVLGFEFGYSLGDPLTLVMWEAQFGDFANGAQIIVDQFISSSESKWGQPSGLVLLLPHGYEGQGPEHSNARLERFLQLCAENNIQVVYPTTPAQYFHLLRRQMYGGPDRRGVRKPLVVMTPKSLLRNPKAVSTVEDLTSGGFREVIADGAPAEGDRVARILACTGKVYYDLIAAREERKAHDVAVLRVEQLYPFPGSQFQDTLARYPATADVVWVQEEPRNMGAWHFMQDHIQPLLETSRRVLRYAGRQESASPATGSHKRHLEEQLELIEDAFGSLTPARSRNVRVMGKRKR